MEILETINKDVINAMKNGDKKRLTTLRMAKNAIQMEKIKLNHELSNDEVIITLKRQVKQKEDSIIEYAKYNKDDVVNDLKEEISVLKNYLPAELSEEDINKGLDEIFAKVQPTSMKDMKVLMQEADAKFGSSADKAKVSSLIRSRLN
jgi:uncharacterized protein YqeY